MKVPLCVAFNNLFILVSNPNSLVSECFYQGEWVVEFKRTLIPSEYDTWRVLKAILEECSPAPDMDDSVSWALEKKGKYSTKFLYRFITDGGMIRKLAGCIWKCKVPLKIKFFLWQVCNNKLQVAQSLAKRGWKGDIHVASVGGLNLSTIYSLMSLSQIHLEGGRSYPKCVSGFLVA